ncbi:hypothetical protein [Cyclobacterium marinum]|uniref:Uncharacterized protein n=1 Tax=Cyclobacterium marinum (strain ATCC 25205 / DSM 745 / LMG 13164 / NCIMB 1802) TaxID=880070 RepID=G0IXG7_CYCMS|nr:hypothetical protein [Cyclobacterium marinum]AEL27156.1 hypothetical protein Cycma_3433 [Cyclobacterium marinum DSM 745]|tara:strand:- start:5894 stop:6859 length:966 start_codon:yes stop_codon:yes gene_type:complete
MRDHYQVDWAFAIKNSLDNVVQENFPQDIHRWPVLKAFDFDSYLLNDYFVVIKLKDKISGIPAGGSGRPKDIDLDNNAPNETPNIKNIDKWLDYLNAKLSTRPQDVLLIVPYKEGGKKVEEDWAIFTEEEKQLWHRQIEINIARHFYYLKGFDMKSEFFLPPGYQFLADDCKRLFDDHPDYNKNVFIMTRFVPGNKLLEDLDSEVRRVLRANDLNPIRADDKMYLRDRNLWNNVCVYMNCCKYGIAILEDRIANEFNPNVALEYGYMRALNKPVLLLADTGFRNLRADIIGTLREQFDITDINGTIDKPILKWLKELNIKK